MIKGTKQPGPIRKLEKLFCRHQLWPALTDLSILTSGLQFNPRRGFSQIDHSTIPKGQCIHSGVHWLCHTAHSTDYKASTCPHFTLSLLLIPCRLKITCPSLPFCSSTTQTQGRGQTLMLPISLLTPGTKVTARTSESAAKVSCTSVTILLLPHCSPHYHSGRWERRINMGIFPICKQQRTSMIGNNCSPLPRKRE